LEAFTTDLPRFSAESVRTIDGLAGGNPREIIRIAYQTFEKLRGALDRATYEDLVSCAVASGTVADREKNALGMADSILRAFGRVSQDFAIGGGLKLDRLLIMNGTTPSLALQTLRATDQLSEVQSARGVIPVLNYLEQTWPGVPLIVVTIGYSSAPVTGLLGQTFPMLAFDEETFPSELQTRVVELLAKAQERKQAEQQAPPAAADPVLVNLLQRVSSRLDDLETSRRAGVESAAQTFTTRTLEHAAPELEKRELRTKWDLLEELDRLADVADPYHPEHDKERQIVRGILVANEST